MVSGIEGRRALDVALQVVAQINENRARVEEMLPGGKDLFRNDFD